MGIAKSLRKSGHLSMLAKGLADVFNKLNEDDSENEYLKQVADTKQKVSGRFQPQPNQEKAGMIGNVVDDPFMQLGGELRRNTALQNIEREPDEKVDYDKAGSQSLTDIAEFVMSSLGKKGVDPNLMKSAVEGLSLYRSSLIPGKEKAGDIKGVNPEYDVYQDGKLIKPGEKKEKDEVIEYRQFGNKVYKKNEDGSINFDEFVYEIPEKPSGKGDGSDGGKDYTKLKSNVVQGIDKVKLLKKAKWNEATNSYDVPDPKEIGSYFSLSQTDLDNLKEGVKNDYKDDADKLVSDQGLDVFALPKIRELLSEDKTGKKRKPSLENLEETLKAFKKMNPEYGDVDINILRLYFTLGLL